MTIFRVGAVRPVPARVLVRAVVLLAAAAPALVAACAKKEADAAPAVQTAPAARQDVVVDVEATGQITPVNAVDVRSKAAGQITRLAVTTGDRVKAGDLLVRIDPRDPQSRFDQAAAAVRAAQAQAQVTRTQYERNRALLGQGVITAPETEATRLAYANAQSSLTGARTQLDLARIALEDVTIRAPSAGTVIARNVAPGTVVASSVNSPSGGTVLLTLADLATVYDSTLVNESDIGKVRAGQQVRVTVDAYPGRTFRGTVEKVEPRATVQQSVTFFPVLVRLENADGALMPGMNTDVSILVDRRDGVLAVPLDAVRGPRDAAPAAAALGIDPQGVRQQLQAQRGGGAGRDAAASNTVAVSGGAEAGGTGAGGAAAGGAGGSGRRRGAGGSGGRGAGGSGGGAGAGGGGGAAGGSGAIAPGGRAVVFVKDGETFAPRVITAGLSNYDLMEVTSGLREGEQVALVSAAVLQQQRSRFQERLRSRNALPGTGGGGNRGGAGGAAGGGAGGAGGGGRGAG
jgi:HlyD family secretion protein